MHEFMEYVFEPNYKRLKVVMASEPADNAGLIAASLVPVPLVGILGESKHPR